jgi:hypothetical protein
MAAPQHTAQHAPARGGARRGMPWGVRRQPPLLATRWDGTAPTLPAHSPSLPASRLSLDRAKHRVGGIRAPSGIRRRRADRLQLGRRRAARTGGVHSSELDRGARCSCRSSGRLWTCTLARYGLVSSTSRHGHALALAAGPLARRQAMPVQRRARRQPSRRRCRPTALMGLSTRRRRSSTWDVDGTVNEGAVPRRLRLAALRRHTMTGARRIRPVSRWRGISKNA